MEKIEGKICEISGPMVVANGIGGAKMYASALIGEKGLVGEIIRIDNDRATIQVYEDTRGLYLGEKVLTYGKPLTVELGPGLLSSIYDGIQRPLESIRNEAGDFIKKGVHIKSLDRKRKWRFTPVVKKGDRLEEGDIIGVVGETPKIVHKITVPNGVSGIVEDIKDGEFTVEDDVAVISGNKIKMLKEWGVRNPRPYKKKLMLDTPFITGQRVFDFLFPIAVGGTAVVPGGFGTGKTVIEQTLAKFSRADIIVYVGCGERGNEMTEVLTDFPKLTDPVTGDSLMNRTILVINTSNMPVAAREASIFTGVTMAEYFRDMGYHVALMVDSTSRWAEALREISSGMEEMPGEEGYPPYLATRLGNFYERAGKVVCLGRVCSEHGESNERVGSVTIVSAISPPGGDFSEPVTQSSLRIAGALWSLDTDLAYRRHFPAVSWVKSFSLYMTGLKEWYSKNIVGDVNALRERLLGLLQKAEELNEVVQLVGLDAIQDSDRITIDIENIIIEGFLRQSVFHDVDAFCTIEKQYWMLNVIFIYYDEALNALKRGVDIDKILDNACRTKLLRMVDCRNEDMMELAKALTNEIENIWI
ncbi:MAG: V-type ATP synthase subunit A [Nitrospinae bacterium RIFCSPLOWO2_12_39_16]|nr:MAG: V-type ATP synthase subunit A [Nitrospinae bacterium RIFCSPLOWO2_02_39_17]OGW11651.1 MAG: V-type ATP synthase subunit A [Nitrospinae bacterium RIFCSPLOWO2_12_39_16]